MRDENRDRGSSNFRPNHRLQPLPQTPALLTAYGVSSKQSCRALRRQEVKDIVAPFLALQREGRNDRSDDKYKNERIEVVSPF
jgi:hypothetical protein